MSTFDYLTRTFKNQIEQFDVFDGISKEQMTGKT